MAEKNQETILGKKIFFLYPHSIIQDELIEEIQKQEYEAYILKDHKRAKTLLNLYNDSILFINIDSDLKETEWEKYIAEILNNPSTKDVKIGVLTYNEDQELAQKYLMELGIHCGFIVLKLGLAESKKIILRALEANEAKGRRKYLRAKCNNSKQANFNIKIADKIFKGIIHDISSVGMACSFEIEDIPFFSEKSSIDDLQLTLKGSIIKASGVVIAIRTDEHDKKIYVVMFKKNDTLEKNIEKIQKFIYTTLQNEIDKVLKTLPESL